jgi:hypothetical protein
MKIETHNVPQGFQPVTICLTFNTLDELRVFWAMTNVSNRTLQDQATDVLENVKNAVWKHTNAKNGCHMEIFRAADAAMTACNGKN